MKPTDHMHQAFVSGRTLDAIPCPAYVQGHPLLDAASQGAGLDITALKLIGPHFLFGMSGQHFLSMTNCRIRCRSLTLANPLTTVSSHFRYPAIVARERASCQAGLESSSIQFAHPVAFCPKALEAEKDPGPPTG